MFFNPIWKFGNAAPASQVVQSTNLQPGVLEVLVSSRPLKSSRGHYDGDAGGTCGTRK